MHSWNKCSKFFNCICEDHQTRLYEVKQTVVMVYLDALRKKLKKIVSVNINLFNENSNIKKKFVCKNKFYF